MREVGVVLGTGGPLYWHLPPEATETSLPDSPELWRALWRHREVLLGFAHTHPGAGVALPSALDLETFGAIERGLGRRLAWWIVTDTDVREVWWAPSEARWRLGPSLAHPPAWAEGLRVLGRRPGEREEGGAPCRAER